MSKSVGNKVLAIMPNVSTDTHIRHAFHAARYVIQAPGTDIVLHIGQTSAAAQELLTALNVNCAALITAYNPGGCVIDNATNKAAQNALQRDVKALGLTCMQGYNCAKDGSPPIEPTVVMLGPTQTLADALAQRYGQLAYVWVCEKGIPALRWF
ncbi:DUF3293 domain-containing protein [Allopusillimonas ginsengisoli]|nr:DUF3293 domain-containing protein [Allopusillimonas ginsengisoli]